MIKILSFLSLLLSFCLYNPSAVANKTEQLEGLLCTMSDFISEDLRRVSGTIPSSLAENTVLQSHRISLTTLQEWVDITFSKVEDIKTQRRTLDGFLQEQLRERLEDLKNRTDAIISFLVPSESGAVGVKILPTDPDLFQRHFTAESRDLNEAGLKNTMKEWEYKQLLIKYTFHALEEGGVSAKTRTLLQLSPSLWDLLQYKTYDLGHPDQAGGYGSFIWIMDYESRIKEAASAQIYKISVLGPQKEFSGELDQAYKRKILPRLDGELYRAYTDRSIPKTFDNLMLGAKGKKFELTLTPLEAETWGNPLQEPDFLFKVKPKSEISLPSASIFSKAVKKESSLPTAITLPLPPSATLTLLPTHSAFSADQDSSFSRDIEAEKKPDHPREEQKQAEDLDEEEADSARATLVAPGILEKSSAELLPDFVMPRGIRLFQPEVSQRPIPILSNPDKKVQKFVNDLFDPRAYTHIAFADFQKNWERIGGHIEGNKKGGSHRHLVAPDGTSLWGTFDHGGFGKQTIGYLQAAFWLQGYKPDHLSSQPAIPGITLRNHPDKLS